MRRQPVAHSSSDARRLSRRALITLGGATAGAVGWAGGLLAVKGAGAAEPPGRREAGGNDDGGLTAHREAYYRRARF